MTQSNIAGWLDDPETPGMGQVMFEDGTSMPVHDPDGTFKAEALEVASRNKQAPAPTPNAAPEAPNAAGPTPVIAPPAQAPGAVDQWNAPPAAPAPSGLPPVRGGLPAGGQVEGPTPETERNVRGSVGRAASSGYDADVMSIDREIETLRSRKAEVQRQRIQNTELERANEIALRQNEQARNAARAKQKEVIDRPTVPGKIFHDMGIFATVMTAIGAIAGGALQARRGGRNEGVDFIESMLSRSIQIQQSDKQSELQSLATELGDLNAATSMMQARQWSLIGDRARIGEAESSLPEEKTRWAELQALAQAKRDEKLTAAEGPLMQRQVQEMRVPKETGPGVPTLEGLVTPETVEEQRMLNQLLEAAYPSLPPKARQEQWNDFAKTRTGFSRSKLKLEQAEQAIRRFNDNGDVSGFGPLGIVIPSSIAGSDANAVRQYVGSALFDQIKAESGAAFTDAEYERRLKVMLGAGDGDSMLRGVQMMRSPIELQMNELKSQYPALSEFHEQAFRRQDKRRKSSDENKRAQLEAQKAQSSGPPKWKQEQQRVNSQGLDSDTSDEDAAAYVDLMRGGG